MRASLSILVVALSFLPHPAAASPISWLLRGEASAAPDTPLGSVFPDSTPVQFLFTIDPAVPDVCSRPNAGEYFEPPTLVTVGGHTYESEFTAYEVNNPDGSCTGSFPPTGVVARMFFTDAPFSRAVFVLGGATGDALPLTLPPVGTSFYFASPFDDPEAFGEITSSEVVTSNVVPESGTLELGTIGVGMIFSLCVLRRRPRTLVSDSSPES